MIFYGDYGDYIYKFELTTTKGKPIPKYLLPIDWTFTKLPEQPITRGILELDEQILYNIYQSTKDDPTINGDPKFLLLRLLITIFETYSETDDRALRFRCETDPTCLVFTDRDF